MATVELTFLIEDVATYYDQGFRRINISRSKDGGVTYYDITHSCCAQPPQVYGTSSGPWQMDGKHLTADLSGETYDVDFVGAGDWDISRIDGWLRAHSVFTAEVGVDGKIILSTVSGDEHSWINVAPCSAATAWGLTTLVSYYGVSAGLTLYKDVINYTFYDYTGAAGDMYRYRLETEADEFSRWSDVITASPTSLISLDKMCLCSLQLLNSDGSPVVGTQVVLSNYWSLYDVSPTDDVTALSFVRELTTDADGKVSVYLLRGMTVDVAIQGSSVVRRVVIPDEDTADLLDPSIAVTPDQLAVSDSSIPAAVRHS